MKIKEYKDTKNKINYLLEVNSDVVKQYNNNILNTVCIASLVLLSLYIILSIPCVDDIKRLFISYGNTMLVIFLIYLMSRFKDENKYKILGLYLLSAVYFSYGLYLSTIRFPQYPATELVVFLCAIPLCITDKPRRLYSFLLFLIVIYVIVAAPLKDSYLMWVDGENIAIFTLLGIFLSRVTMMARLEAFEAQRMLSVEKTTDYLTRLNNRRRLEEVIEDIDAGNIRKPSGVMMIDIDFFKSFNDTYGHKAGDACLELLGVLFRGTKAMYDIDFYRYGGEEFTAFVYNSDADRLYKIAERIRKEAGHMNTGYSKVTISIGIVSCDDESVKSYEEWVNRADAAVYEAKRNGRNQVAVYKKTI